MSTITKTTDGVSASAIKRQQTLLYFGTFVLVGLVTAALGPAIPAFGELTSTDAAQVAIVFTAMSLGFLMGSLLGGRIYDRVSAHTFTAIMLAVLVIVLLLTPVLPNLTALFIALFVIGLVMGTLELGSNTALVWIHGDNVGPYMNALHFFFGVGALLSPILVSQVWIRTGSVRLSYWLLALLAFILFIIYIRVKSPKNRYTKAEEKRQKGTLWLILFIAALFFLYVGAEISFGGWIFTYTTEMGLANVATSGMVTSLFWGALTLGRLLTIPISTRIHPLIILAVDVVGMVLSLAFLIAFRSYPEALWLGTIGVGLFMASMFPMLLFLAELYMPITGSLTSWFLVASSLGGMLVPLLVGRQFGSSGPVVAMGTILIVCVIQVAVFGVMAVLLQTKKGVAQPKGSG